MELLKLFAYSIIRHDQPEKGKIEGYSQGYMVVYWTKFLILLILVFFAGAAIVGGK